MVKIIKTVRIVHFNRYISDAIVSNANNEIIENVEFAKRYNKLVNQVSSIDPLVAFKEIEYKHTTNPNLISVVQKGYFNFKEDKRSGPLDKADVVKLYNFMVGYLEDNVE